MGFDPRTMGKPVYEALNKLSLDHQGDNSTLKDQKNQAVELYTYLSTWGLMRLKAEEKALSQEGKKQIVKTFFECLEKISETKNLSSSDGLEILKKLDADDYLGLTGLGLIIAQEFSFWATAVYVGIELGE
ncbi:hypothetical protein GFS31_41080 (plasmid) [Leptolyngbya sp. BL0902]|uniref:hypothetical protein n=1 Tax=Leptolyngbya sp. BL0902 TaxID=1115757 RepID=UPI0018E80709|nr:hypothetical protein [Leptolyngbya sp. BL0902]QQE67395.1 hypothetical protein GFS31_41080 [Leptolyngbya sp. BL0902]